MAIGPFNKRGFWSADTCGSSFLFYSGGIIQISPLSLGDKKSWNILLGFVIIWMFPKIVVPKMDGENNGSGKPYEQMDDLGVLKPPLFLVQHPNMVETLPYFRRGFFLEVPSDSQDGALLGRLQVCWGEDGGVFWGLGFWDPVFKQTNGGSNSSVNSLNWRIAYLSNPVAMNFKQIHPFLRLLRIMTLENFVLPIIQLS